MNNLIDGILAKLQKVEKDKWIADGIDNDYNATTIIDGVKFLINSYELRADYNGYYESFDLTRGQRKIIKELLNTLTKQFVNKETPCERNSRQLKEALLMKIEQIVED